MKLLTKEILAKLPKIGATENVDADEKLMIVKFFNPAGAGYWFACEYNPEERLFFGYAKITDGEWGYFSLDELTTIRLPLGLKIERDLGFSPTKFKDIEERCK